MKKKGINKFIDKEGSTKTYATRILHMNNNAYEAMEQYLKYSYHKKPDDYLIATKDGGVNNIKNITDRLKIIEAEAKTKVRGGATHVLRHTCASLYFRQGNPVEIIASILGNSADVCRTTYVHFIEDQQRQASHSITRIDIP
jgi:site-specific recombinase XerD